MKSNFTEFNADFYKSVESELLDNILPYWNKYSQDTNPKTQGFFAEISNENVPDSKMSRSIVMTSRFLWTYSAVARFLKDASYLKIADFAYNVILQKFFDKKNGGVYWSVKPDGTPDVSKKQIYGEAFCCYGLCEYAAAVKELREKEGEVSSCGSSKESPILSCNAMNFALDIYNLLETYAHDFQCGGYVEARARNWKPTSDMILSPKDMNCPKSMNTNLHVMEAYTNLYRTLPVVFPDSKNIMSEVAQSLSDLVTITVENILQPNAHLGMFFDMDWNLLSDEISYGHDIECSWLLWEAACELNDENLKSQIRNTVIKVAQVAYDEGFDKQNGCLENFLKDKGTFKDKSRVWWNQAESMNGFYNAWQMTGKEDFKQACLKQWNFIQNFQKDSVHGDWWSELTESGEPKLDQPKGGNWKTSYHNSRTCLELLKRSKTF